jgi:hypothetical protein
VSAGLIPSAGCEGGSVWTSFLACWHLYHFLACRHMIPICFSTHPAISRVLKFPLF